MSLSLQRTSFTYKSPWYDIFYINKLSKAALSPFNSFNTFSFYKIYSMCTVYIHIIFVFSSIHLLVLTDGVCLSQLFYIFRSCTVIPWHYEKVKWKDIPPHFIIVLNKFNFQDKNHHLKTDWMMLYWHQLWIRAAEAELSRKPIIL